MGLTLLPKKAKRTGQKKTATLFCEFKYNTSNWVEVATICVAINCHFSDNDEIGVLGMVKI